MFIFPSLEALSAADPFVNKGGASRNLSCPFEWNIKITAQNVKEGRVKMAHENRTNVKMLKRIAMVVFETLYC